MLLFPLALVMALQVGTLGWSLQSRAKLSATLSELRRRDRETDHLKRVLEEIANQTHSREAQALGQSAPTPPAQLPGSAGNLQLHNAKKFWEHFVLRRRSDFQSIIGVRHNQVQQEKCRAIPFLQTVSHDNCESEVLKNNLCFGRCGNPDRTPDPEGGANTPCPYCSHVKSTRRAVHLQCVGGTEVIKVVTVVEECRCELSKARHMHHRGGPALIDPSLFSNQA